jgi:hypothetical protein
MISGGWKRNGNFGDTEAGRLGRRPEPVLKMPAADDPDHPRIFCLFAGSSTRAGEGPVAQLLSPDESVEGRIFRVLRVPARPQPTSRPEEIVR